MERGVIEGLVDLLVILVAAKVSAQIASPRAAALPSWGGLLMVWVPETRTGLAGSLQPGSGRRSDEFGRKPSMRVTEGERCPVGSQAKGVAYRIDDECWPRSDLGLCRSN